MDNSIMQKQKDITRESLLEEIRSGLDKTGKSVAAVEREAKIPAGTLKDFFRGRTHILRGDKMVAVLGVLRDSAQSEYAPPPPAKPDIQPAPDEFISVPVYNVLASAGGGAWLDDRTCIIDSLTFRRDWLRKKTSARPQDMAVIKVHGDSMEPMLKSGDCVLVDMTQKALAGGGVFVIEQDGALQVKRLLPLPGNKVLVISENDRYPDYEMQDGASIVGRAIHKMGDI